MSIKQVGEETWCTGSSWHRWDPHIHTPGTLFEDRFNNDWDKYLSAIEERAPKVEALGITDYCVLASYRRFRAYQREGRAKNVKFVFPNIEFRLTVETAKSKGINLHLLFSPEDPEHEAQIERVLGFFDFEYRDRKYACTEQQLQQLGKAFDSSQTDDLGALREGAKQFKLDPRQVRDAIRSDEWFRSNCLVAICANKADGTAGLQEDHAFKGLRETLESSVHFIFSPRPKDRAFWLGEQADFPVTKIEATYGSLKPCLHGSDAHSLDRVLNPTDSRYCWIRAKLNFSGLRQVVSEPAKRVAIGELAPPEASPSETIVALNVRGARWLRNDRISLNAGLVAIIGPKGNGKTALADMIAHAAGAEITGDSSFLLNAAKYLDSSTAWLEWADQSCSDERRLDAAYSGSDTPHLCYLSQRFVDELCSSEGLDDRLLREIERVVFHALDEESRCEATSFHELRGSKLDHVRRLREQRLQEIRHLSIAIGHEDSKLAILPLKEKEAVALDQALVSQLKEQQALVPKGQNVRSESLSCYSRGGRESHKGDSARGASVTETRCSRAGILRVVRNHSSTLFRVARQLR